MCRVCFKKHESYRVDSRCPHCNSESEENYRLDSPIVSAFLKIMGRGDSEEERLRAVDEVLRTDLDFAYELQGLHNGSTMSGWICPRDRHVVEQVLLNYPESNPVVLEIGVAGGGCSNAMMVARRDCAFIGVDDWSADDGYRVGFLDNTEPFKERVEIITGDSRVVGKSWSRIIDVLLIDGGHDYEVASADIRNFVPWVKNGGVVMVDDYLSGCPAVVRAVDESLGKDANLVLVRRPDPSHGMAEKLIVFKRVSGFER